MQHNNIILTGIPRSGTTLICYLLNKIPNTVALHEPMGPLLNACENSQLARLQINKFFADT